MEEESWARNLGKGNLRILEEFGVGILGASWKRKLGRRNHGGGCNFEASGQESWGHHGGGNLVGGIMEEGAT